MKLLAVYFGFLASVLSLGLKPLQITRSQKSPRSVSHLWKMGPLISLDHIGTIWYQFDIKLILDRLLSIENCLNFTIYYIDMITYEAGLFSCSEMFLST